MSKVLAIVIARGGSKGIPGKNLKQLSGKPLVGWTIEEALKCGSLDRVLVSTDDPNIADVCRNYGAEVPFMRPSTLAKDNSTAKDVMIHAVKWLRENENWRAEHILLLQPTSPLRNAEDIEKSIEIAVEKKADSVISVTEGVPHPYLSRVITDKGILVNFLDKTKGDLRRQDLPRVYYENGAIYLVRERILLGRKNWFTGSTCPYIMPSERSIDIDTLWDFKLAELIMQNMIKNNAR